MEKGKHPEHDYIDIINEPESNEGYECISEVTYDDGESSHMPKASSNGQRMARQKINEGYEPDKQYESPHVYAEIPNINYESLNPPVRITKLDLTSHNNPEQTVPSASNSMPTLQPKICCGKSARFWIPLTGTMAIVIAILVVVLITGICLHIRLSCSVICFCKHIYFHTLDIFKYFAVCLRYAKVLSE